MFVSDLYVLCDCRKPALQRERLLRLDLQSSLGADHIEAVSSVSGVSSALCP